MKPIQHALSMLARARAQSNVPAPRVATQSELDEAGRLLEIAMDLSARSANDLMTSMRAIIHAIEFVKRNGLKT